jgi:hypothetical protein
MYGSSRGRASDSKCPENVWQITETIECFAVEMTPSPVKLPYADLPARNGITSERRNGYLKIYVPPYGSRRPSLWLILRWGMLLLYSFYLVYVIIDGSVHLTDFFLGVIFLLTGVRIYRQACWGTLLEVDSTWFTISRGRQKSMEIIYRWTRDQIEGLNSNLGGRGYFTVRLKERGPVPLVLHSNPQVVEWVAEQVIEALHTLPRAEEATR